MFPLVGSINQNFDSLATAPYCGEQLIEWLLEQRCSDYGVQGRLFVLSSGFLLHAPPLEALFLWLSLNALTHSLLTSRQRSPVLRFLGVQ